MHNLKSKKFIVCVMWVAIFLAGMIMTMMFLSDNPQAWMFLYALCGIAAAFSAYYVGVQGALDGFSVNSFLKGKS